MMKPIVLALVFSMATLVTGVATAAELGQVKQAGLVGERADGFLGLVQEAVPEDVVELVASINDKRRAEYERIANANDLSLAEVQALAGRKAIERTNSGGWIMRNGGWQQK